MSTIETKNPTTGEMLASYEQMNDQELQQVLASVHDAQMEWKKIPLHQRVPYFKRFAEVLREHKQELAELMTKEMGRPIKQSLWEVDTKCAGFADFIVEKGYEWLEDAELDADGKKNFVTFEPLGTVFLVMPWNFPYWQPVKVALFPLLAGNGIILKHASSVTGSALLLQNMFEKAGFPKHLFRTVVIGHDKLETVLGSDYIQAGSLTGSERAGEQFASIAGKYLKKVVLELGGSDPLIVLSDADVEDTAKKAVTGRMFNAGQVCTSSKRILVQKGIAEAFIAAFVQEVSELVIGDPMNDDTTIGPLINEKAVQEMEQFVADAVSKGGEIAYGGKRVGDSGSFFEPTVIVNTTENMLALCTEVFGPVAPIVVFDTDEEAIAIANSSPYGLSSSIFSSNLDRAEDMARQLETGAVFINATSKSDPRIPIGGVKRSGHGRELSEYGAREFVNVKSINIY